MNTQFHSQITSIINELNNAKDLSYSDLRKLVIEKLQIIREHLAKTDSTRSEDENNTFYAFAVFLRGYLDYLFIFNTVRVIDWYNDKEVLQKIWRKMWDCKDRIENYPDVVQGPIVDQIKTLLDTLFTFYFENFGHGIYSSVELKVKSRKCSICSDNVKKCMHIPGRLYNGTVCREIMVDFDLLSSSIVSNPEDPRCRIWPWKFDPKTNVIKGIPIFTFFTVDDFLQDTDWEKNA